MVAFYGFDGFLYSIGFLAGWLVALLVIAEPLKRLGKYTFADALASKFQSSGIRSAAGFSTLVVSIVYLIPQMVGAGALVKPLLGLEYWQGVVLVGSIVVIIVVTAGMVSTTYVQFLKGGLLVLFSLVLTILVLNRGIEVSSEPARTQPQRITLAPDGTKLIDGVPLGLSDGQMNVKPVGKVLELADGKTSTGPLGPIAFLTELSGAKVELSQTNKKTEDGKPVVEYAPRIVQGSSMMAPGNHPTFKGIRQQEWFPKLDFISLMLALFGGTASLPHILIRYYTVKDQASAQEHDCRNRGDRFLLSADSVHRVRSDGQWIHGSERRKHGRSIVGKEFFGVAICSRLGDRFHDSPRDGQRIDRRCRGLRRSRLCRRNDGDATDRSATHTGRQNRIDHHRCPCNPRRSCLRRDECHLPSRLGICHRRLREFTRFADVALLQRDNQAGGDLGCAHRYDQFRSVDRLLSRNVQKPLRARSKTSLGSI